LIRLITMNNRFSTSSPIYVAGHRWLVGSAIVRYLRFADFKHLLLRIHDELDLTQQTAVRDFFHEKRPEYVFLSSWNGRRYPCE